MKELTTESERMYDALFDDKTIIGFTETITGGLKLISDYIEGINGGWYALLNLGGKTANLFSSQISKALVD
jgi:hypothetical protein